MYACMCMYLMLEVDCIECSYTSLLNDGFTYTGFPTQKIHCILQMFGIVKHYKNLERLAYKNKK